MKLLFLVLFLVSSCREALVSDFELPFEQQQKTPDSARLKSVENHVGGDLQGRLNEAGFRYGSAVYLQFFKEEKVLELYIEKRGVYELYKSYEIAAASGDLGPKIREGDGQSPEGFYEVFPKQMNPNSSYHLSFNLGFPNAYDRSHGRTGSFLMVHGSYVSVGCYAMTDAGIEEIYLLCDAALRRGQKSFAVHCFPFRMTKANLVAHKTSSWYGFWLNLKQGYDAFERNRIPPKVIVINKIYLIK